MGVQGEELLSSTLPLLSLNHVSFVCKSVTDSAKFYQEVLGFELIKRPSSFNFEGAWLFKYGIGIHLLQCSSTSGAPAKPSIINPKDNHISFQSTDIGMVRRRLGDIGTEYVSAVVEEGGIQVDQLFFHDPDGYMIEICDCQKLPVLPLSSSCTINRKPRSLRQENPFCTAMDTKVMENLVTSLIGITM